MPIPLIVWLLAGVGVGSILSLIFGVINPPPPVFNNFFLIFALVLVILILFLK